MKKIAKYIGSLAVYLAAACGTPTPVIVSYHPHMPVETQRGIAENSLRQILPKLCTQYEFSSPEKITCRQRIDVYDGETGKSSVVKTFSDVSCSQIEGIYISVGPFNDYGAILRGDCEHRLQSPQYAGKCKDNIINTGWRDDSRAVKTRDLYEALYAYCTSHSYPIQIYGDPKGLFGR